MSCCLNDLGSFPHNRDINTGLAANGAGVYELRFTGPNYSKFSKYIAFSDTEDIIIPAGILNEDFQYTLEIFKPDGTNLLVDECQYFGLRTFINIVSCDDIEYL